MRKFRCLLIMSFASSIRVPQEPANGDTLGTAFTYQGRVIKNGSPVTDDCDFTFGLWNAAAGGGQVGNSPQALAAVPVSGGLFTVNIDFGVSAFNGNARWLEISVDCPSGGGPTTLLPRQELKPAPHAIYSSGAPWTGLISVPAGFADNVDNTGASTLDQAYDGGGAGAGRTISADAGAVNVSGSGGVTVNADVGIGTTAPGAKLDVQQTDAVELAGRFHTDAGTAPVGQFERAGSADSSSTEILRLQSTAAGVPAAGFGGSLAWRFETSNAGLSQAGNIDVVWTDPTTGSLDSDMIFRLQDAGGGVVEKMRLTSDGFLGIGEPNPNQSLDVADDANFGGGSTSFDAAAEFVEIRGQSDTWFMGVQNEAVFTDADFFIGLQNTEDGMFHIQHDGNVGIGTTTPDVPLNVLGGTNASLADGTGYLVLGNVGSTNLVIDNNEIQARSNAAAVDLFLNASGGDVGIRRTSASFPLHIGTDATDGNGAHLTAGGVWTNGSDRNSKQDFQPLNGAEILARLAELPVMKWRYKGEPETVRHIGPTAQDFYAAFGTGDDERYIGTIDADGVALAAIQSLYQMVQERECEAAELRERNEGLQRSNDDLAARLATLETAVAGLTAQHNGDEQ